MFLGICFYLFLLGSEPVPLVLKSGTVLECASYKKIGDWVVVHLADGFEIKATEKGPRKFKVAAQKVDWDETEKRKPVAEVLEEKKQEENKTQGEKSVVPVPKSKPESGESLETTKIPIGAEPAPVREDEKFEREDPPNDSQVPAPQASESPKATVQPYLEETQTPKDKPPKQNGPSEPVKNNEPSEAGNQLQPTAEDEVLWETTPFRERTFAGRGGGMSEMFFLEAGQYVFEMKHNGLAKFGAQIIEQAGKDVHLLANEIGDVWGSKAVHIELSGYYMINIQADGEWAISVEKQEGIASEVADQ